MALQTRRHPRNFSRSLRRGALARCFGRGALSRSPRLRAFLRVAKVVALGLAIVWFCVTVLFRIVNPPVTPLMVLRSLEYRWQGKQVRTRWEWIPLSAIPISVQRAVVTGEDARYMNHWGLDLGAFRDALSHPKKTGPRGASTITMQTVKNVFLWPYRSYVRKALELMLAVPTGIIWGKRRTLELYLNVIEWGPGIYGIESAAQTYFGVSAAKLSTLQGAQLAAMLPSPRTLSPHRLSSVARKRVERILKEYPGTKVP